MSCRAILFDLGQTLLTYPGNTTEYWREFLRTRLAAMHPLFRRAITELEEKETFSARAMDVVWPGHEISMKGRSWHFRDRLRALFTEYHAECGEQDLERLTDAFYEPIAAETRRYPETLGVLRRLREEGLLLAVISNAPWDVPGRLLCGDMERWEINGYFDVLVMSGDVPWRKPNPEFMLAAARELRVTPGECLVVGDSLPADIAGARAAGMRSVWVNRDAAASPAEAPMPDWEIDSLAELPKLVGAS
jgi:HAD superfamily hydrolase (TIGR01509 family)